jgi:hypothetical protein
MIEFVGEHAVVPPDERGDYAEISHVTGREQQGARQLHELRERLLQLVMGRRVPEYQMRRTGADPAGTRALAGRRDQARIGRKPQIIVAAKRDDVAAIDHHVRGLRGLQQAPVTFQATRIERGQIGSQIG